MADLDRLARAIFNTHRAETETDGVGVMEQTKTIYADAASDSSNGSVRISLSGGVETDDGTDSIEVPTTVDVKEGDSVVVTLTGGTASHPVVTGVVGGGDRTQKAVDTAVNDASKAKSDASSAVKTADTASNNAAQALSETKDLVTLRIDSSRGTVFKNNSTSTVLTVHCYKRGLEITRLQGLRDAINDQTARIRWWVLREGDTSWVSLPSTSSLISDDGFTLTITPDDVSVKCTFKAEVVTD